MKKLIVDASSKLQVYDFKSIAVAVRVFRELTSVFEET